MLNEQQLHINLISSLISHPLRFCESRSGVNEIAPIPVRAELVHFKTSTFFSFIFGVHLIVFAQFLRPMSKFTLFLIGAITIFHESFAKLRF